MDIQTERKTVGRTDRQTDTRIDKHSTKSTIQPLSGSRSVGKSDFIYTCISMWGAV